MPSNFKKSFIAALIAFPLVIGLNGCVTTSEMNSLRTELKQTRSQLNKKIDNVDAQSSADTAALRDEIKKSNSPMQTQQANMYAEVSALKMQVAKLQGSVNAMADSVYKMDAGDTNSTLSLPELAEKVEHMRMAIESQLAIDLGLIKATAPNDKATQNALAEATAAVGGVTAVVAPEVKQTAPADAAQALYDKALGLFKKRSYKEAIRDWAEFSATFPKHKLVPNAIFWEGECYYQLKDYANAALKYQVVIAKHPKSNKYRSSLLKQGICLIRLGKSKSGKYILEDLIKKAPDSAEAKRAKNIIKNLK